MAKQSGKPDIPVDMWLHVATDALARYVAGGGLIVVASDDGPGVVIRLPGVALNDPRLAPAFLSVVASPPAVPQEATP